MKNMNFGSLNVRGIITDFKKQQLADDLEKYKCHITAIQETHIDNDDITEIKTSDNKKILHLISCR